MANTPVDVGDSSSVTVERKTVGDLLCDLASRRGWVCLSLLLVLVTLSALAASHRKVLWYDELFTVLVATQPTWHRMAQAMPADANPPLYPLLARLCIHLFGLTDLAVRLPSLAAFLAALTGVYVFVRRECGVPIALLAVVLTFSEHGWTYAYEARPYALLLAFLMLAMVSWQSATRAADAVPPRPRRLALAGIVVGIAGAMFSHHIGIIEVGVPLVFGEAVRMYRSRRPDWPLLATSLTVLPVLAITLPMARRTNQLLLSYYHESTPWTGLIPFIKYALKAVRQSIDTILSFEVIVMATSIVLVSWMSRSRNHLRKDGPDQVSPPDGEGIPLHILAASCGAILLIPITAGFMLPSTNYYLCRYGIGSVAGISIFACLFLSRLGRRANALVAVLIVYFSFIFGYGLQSSVRSRFNRSDVNKFMYADRSGLPIVVADPVPYLSDWWYAPPQVKGRIVYLTDRSAEIRGGYMVTEEALIVEQPLFSANLEDYTAFLGAHDHVLVDLVGRPSTFALKDRMESSGWKFTHLVREGIDDFYDAEKVSLPSLAAPCDPTDHSLTNCR